MEWEFVKREFYKLDAFLTFYLKEENSTIDILNLVNLIDSNLQDLSWESEVWKKVLEETTPPLKSVILLLENDEFREIKFEGVDFREIGFHLDSPKLFSSNCRKGDIKESFNKASKKGKIKIVKYLYEVEGCDPTTDDNWAINQASMNGYLEVVKYLFSIGCDPTVNDNMAIQWASHNGNLEVVKYFYEEASCVSKADDNWVIQRASENGRLEVVKYLVSLGCNPTSRDNYAIRWASYYGHLEVVKYLYEEAGCDPTVDDNWAIRWASENGHLEVVKYLKYIGCTL